MGDTISEAPHLAVDPAQIALFVNSLFPYADDGTFVSLRAFAQNDRGKPPIFIRSLKLNGGGLEPLIAAATRAAQDAADSPIPAVFAPPVATFSNGDRARGVDLANDVVLSVEVDENPTAARLRLEGLLGLCTLVVASGSDWMDPETGEYQPKLHLYWRLSEATNCAADHDKVRLACSIATRLIGADPTGVPAVHPLRCPGSWNVKGKPRLARIVADNPTAEINLDEALETLAEAQEQSGLDVLAEIVASNPTAAPDRITSAMAAIPNPDVHYADWMDMGYACWNSIGGDAGFDAWDSWSRKSAKYQADETISAWKRIAAACTGANPPRKRGAGSIFWQAKSAGWKEPAPEPPHGIDDPGYYESLEADAERYTDGRYRAGNAKHEQPHATSSDDTAKLFDPWAKLQPPPLPLNALPPVLQAFAEDRHEVMGADPGAVAWSALSASSAALDGSTRLHMKMNDRWHISPAIWVAILGPPSSMKTPIIRAAWGPLERVQKPHMDNWKQRLAIWHRTPKKERSDDMPVPVLRFVSNDATIEALQDILSRQDRGIGYLRDELAGWICQFEKYGSSKAGGADRAFFLQSFDGGEHVVDRVGRGLVSIDNCLVTICGGIQPERLRQFADITDDGLWQRFVPIIAAAHKMGCDRAPSSAVTDYEKAINDIVTVPAKVIVQLSNAAHEIRAAAEARVFELEQSDVLGPRFSSFCGKMMTLWGLLCMVLNYLDPGKSRDIIPTHIAEMASTLLFNHVLPSAAQVYAATGGAGANAEATQSVAGFILAKRKQRVLASELSRSVRACRGQPLEQIIKILSPLVAGGWFKPEQDFNPNAWIVSDLVHSQFTERAVTEARRRAQVRDILLGDSNSDADAD